MDIHQEINSKKWNNVWGNIEGNDYPHEQLVKYVNIKKDFPVMKALDIGFGSGANMRFLHEKGFSVSGLEVSENSIHNVEKRAKMLGISLDLRLLNPPYLPFDDKTFGFVCSVEAIYYNIDVEKVINEVYRILAPKGKIYVSFRTPNHGVVKQHARVIENTLMEWKEDIPQKEMAGIRFRCFEEKEDLYDMFYRFADLRVDKLWTDLLGEHFELLLVTGEKR